MSETIKYKKTVVAIHRCKDGGQLFKNWKEAITTGDPGYIFSSMQAYFMHKNGNAKKAACNECRFVGPI